MIPDRLGVIRSGKPAGGEMNYHWPNVGQTHGTDPLLCVEVSLKVRALCISDFDIVSSLPLSRKNLFHATVCRWFHIPNRQVWDSGAMNPLFLSEKYQQGSIEYSGGGWEGTDRSRIISARIGINITYKPASVDVMAQTPKIMLCSISQSL